MKISNLPAPLFLVATVVFQSAAHICLKSSAGASSVWMFCVLQSIGNLAGLVGVLTYTGLLQKLPLHLGFPLTQGFVAIGVLLVGSFCIFHESFTRNQIIGCILVLAGVISIGLRATHLESSKPELP
jgi:multidrug transporter EmrE-like cation transporter